ncbi:hypothetical protein [Bordetella sp. LUAb4]|uniref:hypothetical protein n=1 Tax=Bordetella sp. LUAb4 TaxID=2843195 RepID=UPI001E2C32F1|nr:hypothetical protein [Bordetella sp. LUAb4]
MSDPHAPFRALRNTDRLIAENLYQLERQQHHLEALQLRNDDAGAAASQFFRLEAELASLRRERDALIRVLTQAPARPH